jgi:hypothetical protein
MARALAHKLISKLTAAQTPDSHAQVLHELETRARLAIHPAEPYVEKDPTIAEWIGDFVPTGGAVVSYARELVPFAQWIQRYNLRWLLGDAVAGKPPAL